MSGPELVEVVAGVLASAPDKNTGIQYEPDDYLTQARAVLDALAKAGNVEWGSEHVIDGKRAIESHVWPDRNTAKSKVAIFGGRVVSRLVFPWTAAE